MSLIHSSYLSMNTKIEIHNTVCISRQPGDPGVDSGEARDSAPVTEGDHPNQEEAVWNVISELISIYLNIYSCFLHFECYKVISRAKKIHNLLFYFDTATCTASHINLRSDIVTMTILNLFKCVSGAKSELWHNLDVRL